jgi:hypothetical protein
MIVQISANNKMIGAIELYENNENGEITVMNKTETLSIGELDNMQVVNGLLHSNDNVIDINLDDDGVFFTPEEFKALMSCKSCWVEFETNRNEYELGVHDDWQAALRIIAPLKVYDIVNDKEYNDMLHQVNDFFKFVNGDFQDTEYTYEELDKFLWNLHPLLYKC